MPQTEAIGDGREPSAARRPWFRHAVIGCFLGAGVYTAMAAGTDVAAHAEEPPATTTQADPQHAPGQLPSTDASPGSHAVSTTEMAPSGPTTTTPSTLPDSSAPSEVTSTTQQETDVAVAGSDDTAGTAEVLTTGAEPTASTNSGTACVEATAVETAGLGTLDGPVQPVCPTATDAGPTDMSGDTAIAKTVAASDLPGTPGTPDHVPTDVRFTAAGPSENSLAHRHATSIRPVEVSSAPAGSMTAPAEWAPDDAPLPPAPIPFPAAPSTAVQGLSGCAAPGAGQGSGGAGGSAVAVQTTPLELFHAVNAAGRTAPAAGSVGTTTADPATRPD